jgi:hypothetical protein
LAQLWSLAAAIAMNDSFHPVPFPWSDFPAECLYYLVPMSVLHLVVFIVGCCVLLLPTRKPHSTIKRRVDRFALFMVLFLLVASFFNGLWSCLVWDRLYDSTDYVFDFMPFWPITQSVIDAPWGDGRGRLLGVTLFQLQLVWFAFALSTWTVTFILFRFISRKLPPNQSPTPIALSVPRSRLTVLAARLSFGR